MTALRTGVLFALRDDPDLVKRAEALGYESAWAAEGQGKTAFGKLERWASATDQIGLATGIVNVFSRSPATLAQSVATLDAHSGGRAILGLGVAHPGVVTGFHGIDFDRPLARMAEYITLVRRYLAGDPDPFDGEFYSPVRTAFWDAFEPVRREIPIYNAALGPTNIRLTGALADGWLPNLYPLEQFDEGLDWLREGAERSGRTSEAIDVAMYVLAAVDDDPATARQEAAEHIAYYLRDIPGYYDRVVRDAGFEAVVDAVKAAESKDAAVSAVSDGLIDRLALTGTPTDAREQLSQIREAGVDLPIVRAPVGSDRETVVGLLETFAPAHR